MQLKLSKKEAENYQFGLDEIGFKNEEELVEDLHRLLNKINYPPANKKFKNRSKEQIFFQMMRSERLLYFYFDKALKKDDPSILLNAFYTYNHINSTFELSSGFDHCIRLKPVIFCFAGNNYDLIKKYLPEGIGISTKGHRLNVTGINLITGIRGELEKELVNKQVNAFLSKKNSRFDTAVIQTLSAILNQNIDAVSDCLNEVTQLHKSSKWLHDFNNPIGKYLPSFSYGLYSIAYKHLKGETAEEIKIPDSALWWHKFSDLNKLNSFKEGKDVKKFEGNLKCINEIKTKHSNYLLQ